MTRLRVLDATWSRDLAALESSPVARAMLAFMQHGTRKRQRFDFLARTDQPRWLVVADRCSRIIECSRIEPGADLRAVLENALAQRKADGWTVADHDGRWVWSGFFCERNGERVSVSLAAVEPLRAN